MSIQQSAYILSIFLILGALFFLYILIKDRIEIIRSIKPKNLKYFFGYYENTNLRKYLLLFLSSRYDNPLYKIILNSFMLFIWVPFWVLDKIFSLNIFEDK
ncbi:hypothetical protein D6T69_13515 [Tenacibaculum singaporense]|uniref:Uncharacterized protein n=1 Tax=Tenacibaculum singaporense TaxID=2358479 RepID=A0A3Q8RRQ3_9FLAO|nr:hypothetical protein D6T69_13515 [Tenacibaculum singaporense]